MEVGKQGAASCSESGTGQANVAVSIHITEQLCLQAATCKYSPAAGFGSSGGRWLGQKKKNPGAPALLSALHGLYWADGPCVFERGGCNQSLPCPAPGHGASP